MEHHAHIHEWDRYIIYSKTFRAASEYAAENGWWLHCWRWRTGDDAPDAPTVIDTYSDPAVEAH